MKKLTLMAIALYLAAGAQASEVLTISGLPALIAEKAKEAKAATILDFNGSVSGAAYLPVWTFHGGERDYLEVGVGGKFNASEARFILPLAVNFPAVSAKVWGSAWAQNHVRRSPFPPIFLGPTISVPVNTTQAKQLTWAGWRSWLGVIASVRLGK